MLLQKQAQIESGQRFKPQDCTFLLILAKMYQALFNDSIAMATVDDPMGLVCVTN